MRKSPKDQKSRRNSRTLVPGFRPHDDEMVYIDEWETRARKKATVSNSADEVVWCYVSQFALMNFFPPLIFFLMGIIG